MKPFTPALLLTCLVLSACGEDEPAGPPAEAGLPADVVSTAVQQVDFLRAWAGLTLHNWDQRSGPPDATWSFREADNVWHQEVSGYSNVYVGGSSGSGEVRNAFAQQLEVQLWRGGEPVRDFADADALTMSLQQERTRYSLPEGFPLDDPHHYTTSGSFQLHDLHDAHRVLEGDGQQSGVDRLNPEGDYRDYVYATEFHLKVAGDVAAQFCAAETLTASVAVFDSADQLLDRFAGRFASAAGGDLYTGQLDSELGPWIYGINAHRSCSTAP